VPIFLKSGSLNLLEPSGHVKACNGIALPLNVEIEQCSGNTTVVVRAEGSVPLVANSFVLNDVLTPMVKLNLIMSFLHFAYFQLDSL
jgi:hypothetical protein